jgi:hypothetical protein
LVDNNAEEPRRLELQLAWPALVHAQGPERGVAAGDVEVNGEIVPMNEEVMSEWAAMLNEVLPYIEVDLHPIDTETSEGEHPFTHLLLIVSDEHEGPREWLVAVAEEERIEEAS